MKIKHDSKINVADCWGKKTQVEQATGRDLG